ncbi:hypothetical protein BDD12DRAFT_906585 [Trichophaea hybrida]|nr:hypothetical protein BDD12DRAFT_906585 [Trichophaea hybrida]
MGCSNCFCLTLVAEGRYVPESDSKASMAPPQASEQANAGTTTKSNQTPIHHPSNPREQRGIARMEAGFGRMEANIAKNHGELKAEIRPIVWQVRVLLGGASLVVVFLVKTYLDEHNIFTKKQPDAMPQVSLEPPQVVYRPADVQKVEPKK